MRCREYREALLENARGAGVATPLESHLLHCDECREYRGSQQRLTESMALLAAETFAAPDAVLSERVLLAELQRAMPVKHPVRNPVWGRWAMAGSVAAAAALLFWFDVGNYTPHSLANPAAPQIAVAAPTAAPPIRPSEEPRPMTREFRTRTARHPMPQIATVPPAEFIRIPYTAPLDPRERAEVVRMNLPAAQLLAAGLPLQAVDPAALVQADVLMSMDGRASAVRLISITEISDQRIPQ